MTAREPMVIGICRSSEAWLFEDRLRESLIGMRGAVGISSQSDHWRGCQTPPLHWFRGWNDRGARRHELRASDLNRGGQKRETAGSPAPRTAAASLMDG
ncbi:MAG: hypothetical protein ACI841_000942 [Planctomycetota bacterium]|jgi:hypothetical protein